MDNNMDKKMDMTMDYRNEKRKLTPEELEHIVGGNVAETAYDSQFLYKLGLMEERYGRTYTTFHWNACSHQVDAGWAKAGIVSVSKPGDFNEYYMDGKPITRNEAYRIAMERTGIRVSPTMFWE